MDPKPPRDRDGQARKRRPRRYPEATVSTTKRPPQAVREPLQARQRRPRRSPEATVSPTMRLRQSVREHLEAWAARGRRSVSEVAQELIEEGIRMRECPGICFPSEPAGRTAKIAGTGLAVWEVLRDHVQDQDLERVRRAFGQLSQAQITAAVTYGRP